MIKPLVMGSAIIDLTMAVISASQISASQSNTSVPLTALAATAVGISLWGLTSALFSMGRQPPAEWHVHDTVVRR
jgi:hypothetical protein